MVENANHINKASIHTNQTKSLPAQPPEMPMRRTEANVPPSPAERPSVKDASACKDDESVPCRLLMGECNSSEFGGQLRRDCPASCGVCDGGAKKVKGTNANAAKSLITGTEPCEDNILLPCATLVDKCFSPSDGGRVQAVCPASCGLCNSTSSLLQLDVRNRKAPACLDKKGLQIDDSIMSCSELVRQCRSSVLSTQIQAACPQTCGLCKV